MKLKNKKTGEIIEFDAILPVKDVSGDSVAHLEYGSLTELNEEWEDYKEPKERWYIDYNGTVKCFQYLDYDWQKEMQSIDNYFETKEEAEKAVEKLKAWKRLKEANIDYKLSREYDDFTETMLANVSFSFNSYPLVGKDLDLLFGGKE